MILRAATAHTSLLLAFTLMLTACGRPVYQPGVPATEPPTAVADTELPSQTRTGIGELDEVIDIVLNRDTAALRSRIQFTQTACTSADGLGGPPKCSEGEAEGTNVEVLPFLGPEGHFIRKEQIETWGGLEVTRLVAVYRVSQTAYSDANYSAGEYAIVFVGREPHITVTLQIREGLIVRIDYSYGSPPAIREDDVEQFLLGPIDVT